MFMFIFPRSVNYVAFMAFAILNLAGCQKTPTFVKPVSPVLGVWQHQKTGDISNNTTLIARCSFVSQRLRNTCMRRI